MNQAPAVANSLVDLGTTSEDSITPVTGNIYSLAGITDIEGDALDITHIDGQVISYGQPIDLVTGGQLTIQSNGDFSFLPNGDFEDLANNPLTGLGPDTSAVLFDYTVSDTNGASTNGSMAVVVTGENDIAVVSGEVSGSVTEDVFYPGESFVAAVGTPSVTDPDTQENGLFVAGPGQLVGTYGYVITPADDWRYILNNDDPAVQALGVGETLTDTVTAYTLDGTSFDVTITINGTNDGPVATADVLSVGEDDAIATAGNVLTDGADTDVDGDVLSVSEVNGVAGDVGTQITLASGALLTLNSDGSYNYDPNGAFEHLVTGETATDSFDYTVSDGNGGSDTTTVTITINGANDAAVVSGQDAAAAAEGGVQGELTATGALTVVDPDQNQSTFADGTVGGSYGNLVIDAAGNWTYTALSSHPAIAALGIEDTLTDVVTVSTFDGTTHDITITIGGSNDAPTAFDNVKAVSEDNAAAQVGNVITDDDGFGLDSDPDGDVLTISAVSGTSVPGTGNVVIAGQYGALTIAADGSYSYALNTANPFVIGLAAGKTLTETFTYTLSDGIEASNADLDIIINGITEADQQIAGDALANTIHAAGGNDLVDAYEGDDIIYGHGGNDGLNGGAGSDSIYGGSGLDFIYGETGIDYLYGGDDTDAIFAGDDDDEAWGGNGGDSLDGGYGNDKLYGEQGVDWLYGGFGDDELYGGSEGDALFGQEGQDKLWGGSGGDSLDGGAGNDELNGEFGVDWLYGGDGNDTLNGGDDTDALFGEGDNDNLYGGNGGDSLDGGAGHDNLYGEDGVDWLFGGSGDDLLFGGGDTDVLFGNDGNDKLQGGEIGDSLDGGAGDDILDGGEGVDVLFGDTGADTFFIFNAAQGGDLIRDFFSGEDKLYIDPLGFGVDPGTYSGQISASMFSSGSGLPATLGVGPQFYLETGGQGLWFDATGGDTGDLVIVAGFETGVPQFSDIYFDNPWV